MDDDFEPLECLDDRGNGEGCEGPVEYRFPLSGTGRAFPRCEAHWDERIRKEDEIRARYPQHAPADWRADDAGERWDDDY